MTADDELERRLARALEAADPVPPDTARQARSAFAWIALSTEIAELDVDTTPELAGARSGNGRNLVYRSSSHEIHLEVADGPPRRVIGQFLPAEQASVVVRTPDVERSARTRRPGRFRVDDVPAGPFRVEITTDSGASIVCAWTPA